MEFTTQEQVREAFWQGSEHLREYGKSQNDYGATLRSEWVDFVDMLNKDGPYEMHRESRRFDPHLNREPLPVRLQVAVLARGGREVVRPRRDTDPVPLRRPAESVSSFPAVFIG